MLSIVAHAATLAFMLHGVKANRILEQSCCLGGDREESLTSGLLNPTLNECLGFCKPSTYPAIELSENRDGTECVCIELKAEQQNEAGFSATEESGNVACAESTCVIYEPEPSTCEDLKLVPSGSDLEDSRDNPNSLGDPELFKLEGELYQKSCGQNETQNGWFELSEEQIKVLCGDPIFRENCRKTCGSCPTPKPTETPTALPTMSSSKRPTESQSKIVMRRNLVNSCCYGCPTFPDLTFGDCVAPNSIRTFNVNQSECRSFCDEGAQGSYEFQFFGQNLTDDSLGDCSCTLTLPKLFTYDPDPDLNCGAKVCEIKDEPEELECQDLESDVIFRIGEPNPSAPFSCSTIYQQRDLYDYELTGLCTESDIFRENCRVTCEACPTPVPSAAPTTAPTSSDDLPATVSDPQFELIPVPEDSVGHDLATGMTVVVIVGAAGAVALEALTLEGAGGASLLALGVVLQRTSLLGDVEFADRAPIYRTFCQGFQWTALRFDSDDDGEVAQEASARSRQRRRLNSTTTASDVAVQRRRDRLLLEKPGFSSTLWNSLYLTLAVVAFHLACLVALRVFIARSAQHSSTSDDAGFLARMWKRLRTKIAPWPRWELMCALFLAQGTTESALLLYSVDPTPLHKAIAICLSLFGGLGSIAGCFFLLARIGRGNERFVRFDSKGRKWISAGASTETEGSASEGRDKSSHFAESYGPLFDSFRRERHAYLYLCGVAVPMQLLRSFLIGYVWMDGDGEFAGGRLQALLLFLAFAIEIVIVLIWRPSAAWWENMIIFVDLSCSAGCMLLGTVPERDAEVSDELQYAIIALTFLSVIFILAPLVYETSVFVRSFLCSRGRRSKSVKFSNEDSTTSVELSVAAKADTASP